MKKTLMFLGLFLGILLSPTLESKNRSAESIPQKTVKFFSFGDWGSGTQDQKNVAELSKKICKEFGCDFGLLLGDNFYPSGVKNTQDPYWKDRFQKIYEGLNLPFFAALGNHDWRGNATAQVDFSKIDKNWKMPGFFYSFTAPLNTPNPLLEIFVLNSNQFDTDSEQWLKVALEKSKAPWKMLAFHHPILNTGDKHPPDQMKMWPRLKPIVCGKIDLILSGHEHIFAHLRPQPNDCHYDQIIIGTGGKELYGITTTSANTLKLNADAHFGLGWFEVSTKKMDLKFFKVPGEEAYSYTWEKK